MGVWANDLKIQVYSQISTLTNNQRFGGKTDTFWNEFYHCFYHSYATVIPLTSSRLYITCEFRPTDSGTGVSTSTTQMCVSPNERPKNSIGYLYKFESFNQPFLGYRYKKLMQEYALPRKIAA